MCEYIYSARLLNSSKEQQVFTIYLSKQHNSFNTDNKSAY